jgi:hypothetical protein
MAEKQAQSRMKIQRVDSLNGGGPDRRAIPDESGGSVDQGGDGGGACRALLFGDSYYGRATAVQSRRKLEMRRISVL